MHIKIIKNKLIKHTLGVLLLILLINWFVLTQTG